MPKEKMERKQETVKFTISVSPEVAVAVLKEVESKRFRNASHAFEFAFYELMKKGKKS